METRLGKSASIKLVHGATNRVDVAKRLQNTPTCQCEEKSPWSRWLHQVAFAVLTLLTVVSMATNIYALRLCQQIGDGVSHTCSGNTADQSGPARPSEHTLLESRGWTGSDVTPKPVKREWIVDSKSDVIGFDLSRDQTSYYQQIPEHKREKSRTRRDLPRFRRGLRPKRSSNDGRRRNNADRLSALEEADTEWRKEIQTLSSQVNQISTAEPPHVHLYANITRGGEDAEETRYWDGAGSSLPIGVYGRHGFMPRELRHEFWRTEKIDSTGTFNTTHSYVEVKQTGLYLIYSQITYHETMEIISYKVIAKSFDRNHPFREKSRDLLQCFTGVSHVEKPRYRHQRVSERADYRSCYSSRVVDLFNGDRVWVEDVYPRYVRPKPASTFWGIVQLHSGVA